MAQSSFAQSLFVSTAVAGVVFSAAAIPFSSLKSNVVNVELQNQPIFSTELQYLAAPYLSLAAGVSVAVGIGVFGIMGWRGSASKLAGVESSKAELAKSLAIHQAELERIKFSEARLQNQNLGDFLQPNTLWTGARELEEASPKFDSQVSPAARRLAQVEMGQPQMGAPKPSPVEPSVKPVALDGGSHALHGDDHEPLESLLSQLQQLSRQVEELRNRSITHLAA